MTLVVVPVIPDTFIVEGYVAAGVGGTPTVFIVIGAGLEKTTSTESLAVEILGLRINEEIRISTNAEQSIVASFVDRLVMFLRMNILL